MKPCGSSFFSQQYFQWFLVMEKFFSVSRYHRVKGWWLWPTKKTYCWWFRKTTGRVPVDMVIYLWKFTCLTLVVLAGFSETINWSGFLFIYIRWMLSRTVSCWAVWFSDFFSKNPVSRLAQLISVVGVSTKNKNIAGVIWSFGRPRFSFQAQVLQHRWSRKSSLPTPQWMLGNQG